MSEIKPKKERKFLKTLGKIGEVLIQELFFRVGSNLIRKIGGKKTLPSILFIFLSFTLFAQYPNTGNKQRLGFQTTGDGLTWRGSISDTASIQPINNQNAWVILDTINLKFYTFDFTSNVWNLVGGGGGAAFTQPVDSLFFNVGVPTNNVDTAKMRWDSDLATVVLGLNDNVPNELGFKNFWLVKNQTGSTITKGSIVYANGTVGSSGRITVAKFIANGSIDAKYLLGITAHDLTDGEDGYVISFGKIRQVNTDTFAAGAILYPSPTTAGVWTDIEPVAPNIDMPIGFCINSHLNNGTIAIRVASGYKLSELHDVAISSPVENSSLYYKGGLWRDTTAALLTSDTASMLTNYLRTGTAASTYLPLTGGTLTGAINRQEGSHDGSASTFYYNILNYFARQDNIKYNPTAQITFTDRPGTSTFENLVRTSDIHLMTAKSFNGTSLGQYLDTTLSVVANQDGGRVGISKLNPAYKLDINGTFKASGNSLIGGTLGVTGNLQIGDNLSRSQYQILSLGGNSINDYGWQIARSPQSGGIINDGMYIYNLKNNSVPLVISLTDNVGIGTTNPLSKFEVHGSAVFNEGSTDSDFRVESDGNANMVFVDASTDRVGIGYASPTKTLDVNGEVRINTVTATPTSLLGKDGSNVVGEVTDINQSGIMKVGGTTATTNTVGGINVAHGLSYTPSKVIATIAQLNSYVIVVRGITSTNLEFTIYDSTTGVGLNTVSVGFYWIAFK
jgi:hypothetical protein